MVVVELPSKQLQLAARRLMSKGGNEPTSVGSALAEAQQDDASERSIASGLGTPRRSRPSAAASADLIKSRLDEVRSN